MNERYSRIATVRHLHQDLPQEPQDAPDFWEQWERAIISKIFIPPTHIYASEYYGKPLAALFEAKFVPIDIKRELVQISATDIRSDLAENWKHIIPEAKPDLIKRIAVIGPESAGKTTLCRHVSETLGCLWMNEYARHHLDVYGPEPTEDDLLTFAPVRQAAERALAHQSMRHFMISDTDTLTTVYWARKLFGRSDAKLEQLAREEHYDLTLLMSDECEFTPDAQRYGGDKRQSDTESFIELLREFNRPYVLIKGTHWNDRTTRALNTIGKFLNDNS